MRLFAVDTATEACSCALWDDGRVLERYDRVGRSHTERLLPMVQSLMGEAGLRFSDLDGLVCSVGPGSFAGLRIGLGYAKGLALALDLPVLGVSTLAMLAQAVIDDGARQVLPCINARTDEVYFGYYAADPEGLAVAMQAEVACAPAQVRITVPHQGEFAAPGSGWARAEPLLSAALGFRPGHLQPEAWPRASMALKLALPRWLVGERAGAEDLLPVYLRDSVALTLAEQAIARGANQG